MTCRQTELFTSNISKVVYNEIQIISSKSFKNNFIVVQINRTEGPISHNKTNNRLKLSFIGVSSVSLDKTHPFT